MAVLAPRQTKPPEATSKKQEKGAVDVPFSHPTPEWHLDKAPLNEPLSKGPYLSLKPMHVWSKLLIIFECQFSMLG